MHFAILLPSVLRKGYDHIPVRVHIAEQVIPIRYVPDFPVSGDLLQSLITRNVHPILHVRTSKMLQYGRVYGIPCINPVFFLTHFLKYTIFRLLFVDLRGNIGEIFLLQVLRR